jgi:hypothetical protein
LRRQRCDPVHLYAVAGGTGPHGAVVARFVEAALAGWTKQRHQSPTGSGFPFQP